MVLIADGGSTKCDWVLLDESREVVLKTRTEGLNPAVFPEEELIKRIQANIDLKNIVKSVGTVDFYGAGCGTSTPSNLLKKVIQKLFPSADISINEDTLAAVYAVTSQPGIVCILGTGSNSCYFDGKNIHSSVASLGYVLMDEASGNYFGKRLIRDYYYNKMPSELVLKFKEKFELKADIIKTNLYKEPNPNAYLASFAEFIFTSEEVNGYFYKLISEGVSKFIENRVLCFKEAQQVPIHFVGSIAHFSEDIIKDCLKPYHLEFGSIVRRPIDGLINYYKSNTLK